MIFFTIINRATLRVSLHFFAGWGGMDDFLEVYFPDYSYQMTRSEAVNSCLVLPIITAWSPEKCHPLKVPPAVCA